MANVKPKITPFLWFEEDVAEEAARFYVSIFPDSKIDKIWTIPTETPSGPPGTVKVVELTLAGQPYQAMSGGKLDPFNHAVSFMVQCEDQAEVDRYWEALLRGGTPEQCGWLRDRFGLIWQVTPRVLDEWMSDKDKERAARVAQAMMTMVKIDIAALERARNGG
jgi:predicted 3-demethylubiquinone-9 3-methyltransferase (glyoxalase superfamily)